MCGRYSMALRPAQVRAYLENENMPVYEAPEDEGDDTPRQSYNFAPGYNGLVYRADVPYWGAGPRSHKNGDEADVDERVASDATPVEDASDSHAGETRYKLQTMKWGLIPFWTKRNPDYGSLMKTINCRDDSLIENRGMWTTMKQKKRCIVVAQGFYEWLKKGKEKVPHFVKRKDGKLMCLAGLWDCAQYEGSEDQLWTYTVITTSSNKQLNFLHDRMPVILDNGSEELRTWLDPKRSTWTKELQSLLKPYHGELEVYPVSKDVGKVGNNSPQFMIPVASSENKSNIANFFAKGTAAQKEKKKEEVDDESKTSKPEKVQVENEDRQDEPTNDIKREPDVEENDMKSKKTKQESHEERLTMDHEGTEDNAPLPVPKEEIKQGIKREIDDVPEEETPAKKMAKTSVSSGPSKLKSPVKTTRKTRSATSNNTASPSKPTTSGNQRITNFFGK
ncbi:hypothetical protein BP5796_11020 [Coleophoma crateriformis]|uniref:DUF159-domain-containing protein n=1 Tax=Coleophoma crateriformis TaxID=565419 RepID=A0A3D8QLZ9_9HELO|nr:hypothetical protein BP5796_11020 [Coleophoma crateriformis]